MRPTSTPRAARKPVRLSNRSSRVERELGVAREGAQLGGGRVGSPPMARNRSISARISCGSERLRAERSLLQEAIGDLADRAAADRGDAGDRKQVGHQRVRGLGIGAGERREHALIFRPLPARR